MQIIEIISDGLGNNATASLQMIAFLTIKFKTSNLCVSNPLDLNLLSGCPINYLYNYFESVKWNDNSHRRQCLICAGAQLKCFFVFSDYLNISRNSLELINSELRCAAVQKNKVLSFFFPSHLRYFVYFFLELTLGDTVCNILRNRFIESQMSINKPRLGIANMHCFSVWLVFERWWGMPN